MDDVYSKVAGIISEQLGVEPDKLTETTDLKKDLKADSLDLVEIIMALEDEYGIEVGDGEIPDVVLVKDVVEYVNKQK